MSGVSTFFYLFHKPENNPPRLGTIHPLSLKKDRTNPLSLPYYVPVESHSKQKFHFREVYKALGFGRHKADILRYTHHSYLPFRDVALQYRQRQSCLDYQ